MNAPFCLERSDGVWPHVRRPYVSRGGMLHCEALSRVHKEAYCDTWELLPC